MTKNKIEDLRDHLFEVIEALKDEHKPMDLDRARAVSDVAATIIESAKVEIAAIRAIDGASLATDFIPMEERPRRELPLLGPHKERR